MKRKKEWFDNDSFWRDLFPFMFSEERFEKAFEDIERALKLAKPKGKAVLDLCCGPGRCSIALAKAGYSVTGVDRTEYLLEEAKKRARRAKAKIEWVRADMRDFVRPKAFDLAISMFTSFGYFDDKNEDLDVLRNVFESLRAGGAFLIDLVGKESLAKIFVPASVNTLPDGSRLVVQLHTVFDDWTRIRNEWIVLRNGRARTYRFHHTIYSGQELRERLEAAGFADVALYGNLKGDPYDARAQRLIAVARKPKRRGRRL